MGLGIRRVLVDEKQLGPDEYIAAESRRQNGTINLLVMIPSIGYTKTDLYLGNNTAYWDNKRIEIDTYQNVADIFQQPCDYESSSDAFKDLQKLVDVSVDCFKPMGGKLMKYFSERIATDMSKTFNLEQENGNLAAIISVQRKIIEDLRKQVDNYETGSNERMA